MASHVQQTQDLDAVEDGSELDWEEEDSLVVRLKIPLSVLLASMRREREQRALPPFLSLQDEAENDVKSKRPHTVGTSPCPAVIIRLTHQDDAPPMSKRIKPLPPWDTTFEQFSEIKITQDLDNMKESLLRGVRYQKSRHLPTLTDFS
jgi:hypothetical protein